MIKKGFWTTVLFTIIHKKICYVSIESLQLFCYIFAIKSFKLILFFLIF